MVDQINTGINDNTKIISNVLNYDNDMAILQQGSLRSIKRFFHKVEHPDIPLSEDIDEDKNINKESTISINSVTFVVKFIILILLIVIVWDFLKTK